VFSPPARGSTPLSLLTAPRLSLSLLPSRSSFPFPLLPMATNPFSTPRMEHTVELDPVAVPDVADLPPSIPSLSTDELVPLLRARLLEGLPYTNITPRVVVALNPFQFVHANSDQALTEWRSEYADCGTEGVRGTLGPHVWATAQKAYYHMSRTGQDQAIVLRFVLFSFSFLSVVSQELTLHSFPQWRVRFWQE
jgi:hypothetical protein